jgi:voltage-gated potassium channel
VLLNEGRNDMYLFRKLVIKVIKMNNWLLLISSIALILMSTIVIATLEPETFPTFFEGFWWVMTTVTTVGYGDYSPVTIPGRIYTIFLYLFGIGLIGVLIGKIVDWFSGIRKKREEGKMNYKGENHILIIGWSKKAEYAVYEILETAETDVVIIDLLEKAPLLNDRVFYVKGDAAAIHTLEKASIKEAKAVLIFADETIQNSQLADGKSLLIASTVESYVPEIHTTVEIMHEEHIQNFKHIHVDEFVLTHETISRLAVRSAFTKGISTVYSQLMSRQHGDDLFKISKQSKWKTYRDAFDDLLHQGATLIADREDLSINRNLDNQIPENAELYVICDRVTYEKIKSS